MVRPWIAAWLSCWIGVLGASRGWAAGTDPENAASARWLGSQGATAYQAGNYAEALERFDRAFALLPAPSLGLWAARSYEKLGRLVEAAQRYRQIANLSDQIGDAAIQRKAQLEAKKELEELTLRIPQLGVRVVGTAGLVVLTLDDRPFESEPGRLELVDPGHHVLVGAQGDQRVRLVVDLAMGDRRELVLAFPQAASSAAPAPVSAREPQPGSSTAWRIAGWVGVGVGGVALVTGIITSSVAQSRYDSLREQPGCTRTQCPPAERDRVDSYNSMRSVSQLTTIGGAVLGAAGAGVLFFVVRPWEPVSLALSPGALALSGRF